MTATARLIAGTWPATNLALLASSRCRPLPGAATAAVARLATVVASQAGFVVGELPEPANPPVFADGMRLTDYPLCEYSARITGDQMEEAYANGPFHL